ncbi:MobA/MobL family [Butyrivibrio fibrisolvens 16/4]|nr:MobA/MobL family [Butyrivibrio fibrisolvens 16/4]
MIVDLAIHNPDKGNNGIPNPHFHVLAPIRPLNKDGLWGEKQHREYLYDEVGNPILDKKESQSLTL